MFGSRRNDHTIENTVSVNDAYTSLPVRSLAHFQNLNKKRNDFFHLSGTLSYSCTRKKYIKGGQFFSLFYSCLGHVLFLLLWFATERHFIISY